MKLSIEGIKDKKEWEKAGIKLPSYDVGKVATATKEAPAWVHFGIGNIFRIFIGGIADSLLEQGLSDKGITCVETFDYDVVDKIYTPFDNLVMAVTLKEDGSTDKKVLGSLTEAVKAQSSVEADWSRLKTIFASPQLQMVSFTITEKGYALHDAKGEFFPFIKSDIDNGPDKASSAMAVVAALLLERFNTCKAPLAVVSMDNCSHNGEKLRNSVTEMVSEWAKKGFVGEDFVQYVNDENTISFPWSMIDKITPRPADSVAKALEDAGVEAMAPVITSKRTYIAPFVNAEGPQYLVIEDRFPNGRPQLEKAGVYMTDTPAPLFARSARNCASSSEEICLPSMHMATIAAPLRTLDRMALPSLSSAFFTTASEAFFSSIFSSGSSMMRKDAKAARRFWYSATPSAKYFAFSLPTQIRSMFCIAVSSFI